MTEKQYDEVVVRTFPTRAEMGEAAARDAGVALREALGLKEEVNCVFASAPSQNELLAALCREPAIAWNRVNAFHMDEYIGLPSTDPRSFAAYLTKSVFSRLPLKSIHLMNGMADPAAECDRYADLIERHPIDVVLMGIGENGHLAFNDPPVADFDDPETVKVVELEEACRQQQVNDGCFPNLAAVPAKAITLTLPTLTDVKHIFCVVPGPRKAKAVKAALLGPVGTACPASILRNTPGALMYLDRDAAGLL